jgi:hypothetical protein
MMGAFGLYTHIQANNLRSAILLAGFPLAGLMLGVLAYLVVYRGWAVLIRQERRRRLERATPR